MNSINTKILVATLLSMVVLASCTMSLDTADLINSSQEKGIKEETFLNPATIDYAALAERDKKLKNINKFFDNLLKGKVKQSLELLTADVEWYIDGYEEIVPFAGTYTGIDEVEDYLEDFTEEIDILNLEIQYHLVDDNYINSHVRIDGFVPETGKTFDLEFVYAWEINDDYEITRMDLYYGTYSVWAAFQEGGDSHVVDYQSTKTDFDLSMTGSADVVQKAVYDTFAVGDIPGMVDAFSEQCLWILKGDEVAVPYAGIFPEKSGLWAFFSALGSSNSYQYFGMYKVVEEGNRVDYIGREDCTCTITNEPYSIVMLHAFIVDEAGKVDEFKSYNDSYAVGEAFSPDSNGRYINY